jgi:hypothetical protein
MISVAAESRLHQQSVRAENTRLCSTRQQPAKSCKHGWNSSTKHRKSLIRLKNSMMGAIVPRFCACSTMCAVFAQAAPGLARTGLAVYPAAPAAHAGDKQDAEPRFVD